MNGSWLAVNGMANLTNSRQFVEIFVAKLSYGGMSLWPISNFTSSPPMNMRRSDELNSLASIKRSLLSFSTSLY